jgi:hypothetical protein
MRLETTDAALIIASRPTYRTSRNGVTSGSALVSFCYKGFANSLAVTLFGELL